MAVFGLPPTRQMAYRDLQSSRKLLGDLGVKEIVDIGPDSDVPSKIRGIPVRQRGVLTPADLVGELGRTMFGFLSYRPMLLAKSGVFAAYCAQGTIPVVARGFDQEADGLKEGFEVLTPGSAKAAKTSGLERCSEAAWQWYSGHRLQAHAAMYARWLDDSEASIGKESRGTAGVARAQAGRVSIR